MTRGYLDKNVEIKVFQKVVSLLNVSDAGTPPWWKKQMVCRINFVGMR